MDPAESKELRHAIAMQGNLLGQHDQTLQGLVNSVNAVGALLTQLHERLNPAPGVSSGEPSAPTPSNPPLAPTHESHIPTPERYSGELGSCRRFLLQCSLVFDNQPRMYDNDRVKIAFVVSLLSGRAAQWATALWERDSRFNLSFDHFQAEMKKVFDHPVRGKEAANRLLSLRQGTRSVADYAIEFRILAAESGWDSLALQSMFSHGLGENIKDELAAKDDSESLDDLIALAIRLDNRLRERKRERAGRQQTPASLPHTSFHPPPSYPAPSSTSKDSTEEPMQVGRARLTNLERERRFRERLCLYCGQSAHTLSSCPHRPKDGAH